MPFFGSVVGDEKCAAKASWIQTSLQTNRGEIQRFWFQ